MAGLQPYATWFGMRCAAIRSTSQINTKIKLTVKNANLDLNRPSDDWRSRSDLQCTLAQNTL